MHYERNYNTPDHNENCANALRDTLDYLTKEQWDIIINILLHGPDSVNQVVFAVNMFLGVSGFTIHALIEKLRPDE